MPVLVMSVKNTISIIIFIIDIKDSIIIIIWIIHMVPVGINIKKKFEKQIYFLLQTISISVSIEIKLAVDNSNQTQHKKNHKNISENNISDIKYLKVRNVYL